MFSKKIKSGFPLFILTIATMISFQSCSDKVDEKLESLAHNMNTSLPMNVDSITRLDNVTAKKGRILEYNYTIIPGNTVVDYAQLEKNMRNQMLNNAQNNPAVQPFREDDVVAEYHVKDEKGKKLFDIKLDFKNLK